MRAARTGVDEEASRIMDGTGILGLARTVNGQRSRELFSRTYTGPWVFYNAPTASVVSDEFPVGDLVEPGGNLERLRIARELPSVLLQGAPVSIAQPLSSLAQVAPSSSSFPNPLFPASAAPQPFGLESMDSSFPLALPSGARVFQAADGTWRVLIDLPTSLTSAPPPSATPSSSGAGNALTVTKPKTIQDIVRLFEVEGLDRVTHLNKSGRTSKSAWKKMYELWLSLGQDVATRDAAWKVKFVTADGSTMSLTKILLSLKKYFFFTI
jgi:hypothetical protein